MSTSTVDLNSASTAADSFAADWADWHRETEARLAAPHGFLAITSLHWLNGTPQRFDDAPGTWSTGPQGVVVVLDDDDQEIVVDGQSVRGAYRFGEIPERGGVNALWATR